MIITLFYKVGKQNVLDFPYTATSVWNLLETAFQKITVKSFWFDRHAFWLCSHIQQVTVTKWLEIVSFSVRAADFQWLDVGVSRWATWQSCASPMGVKTAEGHDSCRSAHTACMMWYYEMIMLLPRHSANRRIFSTINYGHIIKGHSTWIFREMERESLIWV